MSQMSHLPPSKRLEVIQKELPKGTTHEEIARLCGVTRRTIERDIAEWRAEGGFERWLQDEFFRLHDKVRSDDEKTAYKVIARLLERTLKQKVEAQVEAGVTIKAWNLGDRSKIPTA